MKTGGGVVGGIRVVLTMQNVDGFTHPFRQRPDASVGQVKAALHEKWGLAVERQSIMLAEGSCTIL